MVLSRFSDELRSAARARAFRLCSAAGYRASSEPSFHICFRALERSRHASFSEAVKGRMDGCMSLDGSHDDSQIKEQFVGVSSGLESLFHLLVRCNFKQIAKSLWLDVSRVAFEKFRPQPVWRFFQWRAKKGITTQQLLKPTQKWSDLVQQTSEIAGDELPRKLRLFPMECLAFFIVYPHRLNSSAVRWLDHKLASIE